MDELKELDQQIKNLCAERDHLESHSRLGSVKVQINDLSQKRDFLKAKMLEDSQKELLDFSWMKGLEFKFFINIDYDDEQFEYILFCTEVPEITKRACTCAAVNPVLAGAVSDRYNHVFLRVTEYEREQFFEIVSHDADSFKKFIEPLDISIVHGEENAIMDLFEVIKSKITE